MAELHKLTKNGQTIYPATTTDAVVHPEIQAPLTDLINEYNVSVLYPTGGLDNTDKYNLATAVAKLDSMLNSSQKTIGTKLAFITNDGSLEEYTFTSGSFNNISSWGRFDVNDINSKLTELGSYTTNNEFIRAYTDKDGKFLFGIRYDGSIEWSKGIPIPIKEEYRKLEEQIQELLTYLSNELDVKGVTSYKTLRSFWESREGGLAKIGSQLVERNVSSYSIIEEDYPELLEKKFNYIGNNRYIPGLSKKNKLQTIRIDNQLAYIYSLSDDYIYVKAGNYYYRVPYNSTVDEINESNTTIHKLILNTQEVDRIVINIMETNDGNLLLETKPLSGETTLDRKVFKANIISISDGEINTECHHVFDCFPNTQVYPEWSFKQYGNIVLVSPYGFGKTAQIFYSEDFGDSFELIFNAADESAFVPTKPNGSGGYGANGIHPLAENIIPSQPSNFWDIPSGANGNVHVHSVEYDAIFERIWAATGDYSFNDAGMDGGYSCIWYSDDKGKTWYRISLAKGEQGDHDQELAIASMNNCVLFGSDDSVNGIARYNRCMKGEIPEIEISFKWSKAGGLSGVSHGICLDKQGLVYMAFSPNTGGTYPSYSPAGGVVATDGYRYSVVYIDTYTEETKETAKVTWHTELRIPSDGKLYIKGKYLAQELIIVSL